MAMFILLCGFLVVAKVSPGTGQGPAVTRDQLLAERIARNTLEQVRAKPFDTTDYTSLQGPVSQAEEVTEGRKMGLEFAVKSVTVQKPAGSAPSFGQATVVVEWRAVAGQENSVGNKTFTLTSGITREP